MAEGRALGDVLGLASTGLGVVVPWWGDSAGVASCIIPCVGLLSGMANPVVGRGELLSVYGGRGSGFLA